MPDLLSLDQRVAQRLGQLSLQVMSLQAQVEQLQLALDEAQRELAAARQAKPDA